MTTYSKMEMGQELASLNHISIEKKMFGLRNEAVFSPTGSKIEGFELYVTPKALGLVESILNAEEEKDIDNLLNQGKPIEYSANGCEKLDICMSKDKNFIALQRFCYKDFYYRKSSDVKFFEESAAKKVAALLGL